MGRYSNDGFLTALDKQFNRARTQGSLFISLKRCEMMFWYLFGLILETDVPKAFKSGRENPEGSEPLVFRNALFH